MSASDSDSASDEYAIVHERKEARLKELSYRWEVLTRQVHQVKLLAPSPDTNTLQ